MVSGGGGHCAAGTRCGLPPGWQARVWAGQRMGGVRCWVSGQGVDRAASVLGAESWLRPQPAPLARGRASSPGSAWGSVWLLQAGGPGFPASVLPPAATIATKKPLGAGAADPPLPQACSPPTRPLESRSAPPVSGPLGPQALVTVATGSSLWAEVTYGEVRSPGEASIGYTLQVHGPVRLSARQPHILSHKMR